GLQVDVGGTGDERLEVVAAVAQGGGAGDPVGSQGGGFDVALLGASGREGGHLRGSGRPLPSSVHVRFDVGAPAGELADDLFGDPRDVGVAAADGLPRDTEAACELDAQLRLVEVAGCLGVAVQAAGV